MLLYVVSAKELHTFLEITTDFTTWCNRMFEYGFEEEIDFTSFLTESTGGRPSIDYTLTLDCAKEISMIQRNDKGRQARKYFIDYHPNDKFVTSRTFRRSFATNYYGKIDTSLITAITGHSTEQQLRAYINNNDESNIKRTKMQIDKFHKERKKQKNNIKLTVIPKASNNRI